MLPFQPPLPTAWNLPFQPAAGIHTSILMSESAVGLSVAATRQNAGRSANGLPPPRPPAGAGIAPAATVCASVTVASLNLRPVKLSHGAACTAVAASSQPEAANVVMMMLERMRWDMTVPHDGPDRSRAGSRPRTMWAKDDWKSMYRDRPCFQHKSARDSGSGWRASRKVIAVAIRSAE